MTDKEWAEQNLSDEDWKHFATHSFGGTPPSYPGESQEEIEARLVAHSSAFGEMLKDAKAWALAHFTDEKWRDVRKRVNWPRSYDYYASNTPSWSDIATLEQTEDGRIRIKCDGFDCTFAPYEGDTPEEAIEHLRREYWHE
jgi:hypothetical protein